MARVVKRIIVRIPPGTKYEATYSQASPLEWVKPIDARELKVTVVEYLTPELIRENEWNWIMVLGGRYIEKYTGETVVARYHIR